jgi:uncharacterized protein YndB with AHSA1/START domain
MAVDVTAEVLIDRPIADVAAYAMDPRNEPEWMPAIVESQPLDGPLRTGSKVRRTARFLGRRFSYVPEVTEYAPGSRISMRTDRPFPMIITYSFAPEGDATRMTVRLQGGGAGFFRLAEPLVVRSVRRNINADLQRLRGILERDGAPQR